LGGGPYSASPLPAKLGTGPTQYPAREFPEAQNPSLTQSVSDAQLVKQPVAPASGCSQRKLLQLVVCGWHLPVPCASQIPLLITESLDAAMLVHVGAIEHGVPAGQRAHAPAPLHAVPSMPQMSLLVANDLQSPRGSPN
jgi:hypothetical protein